MQAVVKYGCEPYQVELRDMPEPEIGSTDVLLEMGGAGVCGSDVEQWKHDVTYIVNTPVIMGHEFCGTVRQVGREVRGYQVGDRVASETAAVICGQCRYCLTGEYNLCPERRGFGYNVNGAFTRYVRVPARCLHRIPEGVPFEHAALTEPACVAYNAVNVKSRVVPAEPAVVIGPGPIGLFALQMLRIAGAAPLVVVGTAADGRRLTVAEKLGAHYVWDVGKDDVAARVKEVTGGYGATLVVDAAGSSPALRLAMEIVARNGQITKVGWGPKPVDFSLDPIVGKAATLQGSFSHTWRTWEAVLAMTARGQLDMAAMVSHQMSIAEFETAYHLIEEREAIKVVLHPDR